MIIFPLYDFWSNWLISFAILMIRYLIIAGIPFLIFYIAFPKTFFSKKIQGRRIKKQVIETEISSSIVSFIIFAGFMATIIIFNQMGYTRIYADIFQYGFWYLPLSFILLLIIHDTYFYWIHRMMHLPILFKHIHAHHHRSKSPTPWAAFSFHPVEAILEFIFIIPVVFILPVHLYVFIVFAFAMTIINVLGHLGYELFPKNFLKRPIGKLFNTTTHHDMHHHYTKGNYGLYFNIWDRVMGTNHKKYNEEFEKNSGKKWKTNLQDVFVLGREPA